MLNKLISTMLFVPLFLFATVSASALPAVDVVTAVTASTSLNVPFAIADASSATCQPGSGTPGGWYWCHGKNFENFGSAVGCESVPETQSCYRFKYPKNVRHSIGPDFGGYCQFFLDLECNGPVMDIHIDGKVKDRLDCPGTGNMQGHEGHSMKCFKY